MPDLTNDQLGVILEISKDIQRRIKCNGMPELDEDLAEMIELLEGAVEPPTIDSIEPDEMVAPGPDAQLSVIGTGFTTTSIINWNGGDEITEFVNEGKLTTLVKPDTVQAPLPFELLVYVRNGAVQSNTVTFTFTEEEPAHGRRKRR